MINWEAIKSHYGYGWQTKFAKQIGYTPRMVRRWMAGQSKVPVVVNVAIKFIVGGKK